MIWKTQIKIFYLTQIKNFYLGLSTVRKVAAWNGPSPFTLEVLGYSRKQLNAKDVEISSMVILMVANILFIWSSYQLLNKNQQSKSYRSSHPIVYQIFEHYLVSLTTSLLTNFFTWTNRYFLISHTLCSALLCYMSLFSGY